mmetsp:Transcript_8643/g.14655  ORF Transcript_8643/g.14655 Transcript_8643/m.14655 type:complete len:83 (-) Transcript_8643:869-1117(-)
MFRHIKHPKNRARIVYAITACFLSGITISCITLRLQREELMSTLPDCSELSRTPSSLVELVERLTLMGDTPNVLHELDDIRR